MYSTSEEFNNLIKEPERLFYYSGEIVTVGGDTYAFDGSKLLSGTITRAISGNNLEIGTVYASEFKCELILDVSRYELYNGTITLNIELEGAEDVVPMGTYTISEINQTADKLTIKAYDNMIKFDDVSFSAATYTNILTPYEWLTTMCTACGVTLGNTSAQINSMPNGKRKTGYTDIASDVKSWRDILAYIATYLGGYAYIGRDQKLYIGHYGSASVDTITASFRYSSNLSDYRTTYDGIYGTCKEAGVQEYVANSNSDGLVLDIGANPFLQFTNSNSRQKALKEIIETWNGIYYVPFEADLPMVPTYDPGDVLTFTDNQAAEYDIGAITEIVYKIGGMMSVKCSGDNPRLAEAQDRFTKTIEGVSNEYNNTRNIGGKNFWILSTTNTSAISVGSTEVELTEIEWEQRTYVQDIEMLLTIDAELSATANVVIRMNVDDDSDFEMIATESKSLLGERVFHCTNPQKIIGKGVHTAKVYMTVTDSALLVGDLV